MTGTLPAAPVHPAGGDESPVARLSAEMVRLYKEQFGRGPTRTRSHWAGPDVIVCLLSDTYTPAERRLIEMGEHQRVRDMRIFFQYASEAEFKAAAERATGRPVIAFVSGIDTHKDLSVELFTLGPQNGDSPG
jgi:uncharacterized protein YbcI